MLEHVGAPGHVAMSRTLWLLVAPLLADLALHAYAVLAPSSPGASWLAARVRVRGPAFVGLSAGIVVAHAVGLRHGPALVEFVTRGPRVGGADMSFVLSFDAVAAVPSVLACALALVAASWITVREPLAAVPRVWASFELALAGALLSFAADGPAAMAVGWSLAVGATAWMAGWVDGRDAALAAVRGALAYATFLVGVVWIFWAFAGAPEDRGAALERPSRFVAVRSGPAAYGEETLTVASVPGAVVYLDDGRVPVGTSPFAGLAIPLGPHVLRIRTGGAASETADAILAVEVPASGGSVVVAPCSSVSFRDLATAAAAMASDSSASPFQGTTSVAFALFLWFAAAWWLSVPVALADAPAPLAAFAHGAVALVGPVLLARASDLALLVPSMTLALAASAAVILLASVSALWTAASRRRDGSLAVIVPFVFEHVPFRVGALLTRFERWVLDATGGALVALPGIAAWIASRFDEAAPAYEGDIALDRAARAAEAVLGVSLGRVAWVLLGLLALVGASRFAWGHR